MSTDFHVKVDIMELIAHPSKVMTELSFQIYEQRMRAMSNLNEISYVENGKRQTQKLLSCNVNGFKVQKGSGTRTIPAEKLM